MEPKKVKETVPDALSAQDFTWMHNRVNNRGSFQNLQGTSNPRSANNPRGVNNPRGLTEGFASNQGLPSHSLNTTSALAPLPGWKGQAAEEDVQRQVDYPHLHSGTVSAGVSPAIVSQWQNKLGLQLERAMVKPQEDAGLGAGVGAGLGAGLSNQLANQHARPLTSPALAPWPAMMSGAPWQESAPTSGATSATSPLMSDSLAEEIRQMQQEMQGYGGFAPGETSTEALLAELQALQASMEVPGDSSQAGSTGSAPGFPNQNLPSQTSEQRHRDHVDSAVRSFSLDNDEVLPGFSMDSPFSLDELLLSPSPPPQPLINQPSGVSLLDNYLLGSADGAYSFYQAPQVTSPARPIPNRPIPASSNQNRPIAPGLAQPVPSPLDLINKDFVSGFFSSGGLATARNASVHQGGGRPALFPQADFAPLSDSRKPHTIGRSASLGQASETPLAVPNKKRLFPFATFSSLDHTKRPNVAPTPVRSAAEQATSLGGLQREGSQSFSGLQQEKSQSFSALQRGKSQSFSGPEPTPPTTKPLQTDSENTGGSRLVSAAEIMQALNRLPPRMSHRDFVKSANQTNPLVNQTNSVPCSHQRTRSVSSGLSALCLQDVNAPELFVQMSDEKLVSAQVRALRGGYVSELAELKRWCLENLSEVVVPLIPGVHYLACNALPPARYRVARLMLSKVTLWIRHFQHSVRSISPVDLYMFIHEAARVFLDSDLSLLANIPSQEARDVFEQIYLVMEKMKKEAAEGLRFSDADVNPVKPNLDVKPRVTDPVSGGLAQVRTGSDGSAGVGSDGTGLGFGGRSGLGKPRVTDSGLDGCPALVSDGSGRLRTASGGSGSGLGGSGLSDNPGLERKPGLGDEGAQGSNLGSGQSSGLGVSPGLRSNPGLGQSSGLGSELGFRVDPGLGAFTGLGPNSGLRSKPGLEARPGLGTGPGLGQSSGSGQGLQLGSRSSLGQCSGSGRHPEVGTDSGLGGDGPGRHKRKNPQPESAEGLKKRLGFTNQLGNKGSEQQRQWLKGLQHELTKLNEDEQVVMFNANPGGLAPVRRFVSEAGLMAKYNLRMALWRLLAAASEKFDTLAKGALPSFEKYLGFGKYILGTCVGLTMAFCAIAGRQTRDGKWEPKAEAVQSLLERTKKGMELAAELACIMSDLRTYEEDLLKLRVNSVGVMMREGGRSQQDAVALLEQRAETILTALVAEVTSPPANNPVLWTCWQLIFDFSRAQVAFHVVDDLDAKVERFFDVKDSVKG